MHGWRRRALKCDQGSFEENELLEKHNFPTAFLICYQDVAEASSNFLARACRNDVGLRARSLETQWQRSCSNGGMAQWVAHRIPNPKVGSSSLPAPIVVIHGLRYRALGRSEQTVGRWDTFGKAKRLDDFGAAIAKAFLSKPNFPATI